MIFLLALAQSELPPSSDSPIPGMAYTGPPMNDFIPFLLGIAFLLLMAGLMFWLAHREAELDDR